MSYVLMALVLVFFVRIGVNAWVAEDAYVTFRVIDNFTHGLGLRWNPDQRVQAYSNPLWMFLLLPFYAVTHNIYYTAIAVSWAVNLVIAGLALRHFQGRPAMGVSFFVALLASRSFTDFTVSGLENPLSFLLILVFHMLYLCGRDDAWRWRRMVLAASLLAVNRADLAILALPALLHMALRLRGRMFAAWACALPAALWFGFALFYYGTPLPNTFYAKLHAGISTYTYHWFGWRYILDIFVNDTPTALVLVLGIAATGWHGWRWRKGREAGHARAFLLGLGASLYCYYVFSVGGDFMSGRFWTPPFFVFALLLADSLPKEQARHWLLVLVVCCLAGLGLAAKHFLEDKAMKTELAPNVDGPVPLSGIVNERSQYFGTNALLGTLKPWQHTWGLGKKAERDWHWQAHRQMYYVTETNAAGMIGFYLGPKVIVIDSYSLADPLLARLPCIYAWRAGHYPRETPYGYITFRATGDDSGMEQSLRLYNRVIWEIVAGDLFSLPRLRAIAMLHLGMYDELLKVYTDTLPHCQES